ncbi:dormancy-associated translation inhibitor [Nocardia sp. IFM 10818]
MITCGAVPAATAARAEWLIERVLRRHDLDADARVRLTRSRAANDELVVQVNLDTARTPIRTQISGPTGFALTFAAERLDRRIHRMTTAEGPRNWPDPSRAPLAAVSADRPVVRRKAGYPLPRDIADAIALMEEMDFDACLFTDAMAGEDAMVYWSGPLGVRLVRQRRMTAPKQAKLLRLTVNPHPTGVLTEPHAVARLCGYGLPFLFFTDAHDGRGRLLYRRYDGDLGMVVACDG